MKAGRNDPCPCGSGEKYKKCCLLKETAERSGDMLFREMEANLMERMLPYADETFGETAIDQAWHLFLDDMTEVAFDPEDPLNLLFIPWFLYNWVIEEEEAKPADFAPMNKTVAEMFLESKGPTLKPEEVQILQASNRRPLSFYEVLDVVPGKTIKVLDLMRNEELLADEDTASQSLKKGEIIVGSMMLPLQGKIRPLTMGPFALPTECRQEVIDLKEEVLEKNSIQVIDEAILHQEEAFTLGLYLDLLDEILEEDGDGEEDKD